MQIKNINMLRQAATVGVGIVAVASSWAVGVASATAEEKNLPPAAMEIESYVKDAHI